MWVPLTSYRAGLMPKSHLTSSSLKFTARTIPFGLPPVLAVAMRVRVLMSNFGREV